MLLVSSTESVMSEVECPLCGEFSGSPKSVEAHISGKSDPIHKGEQGSAHREKLRPEATGSEPESSGGSSSGGSSSGSSSEEMGPPADPAGEAVAVPMNGLDLGGEIEDSSDANPEPGLAEPVDVDANPEAATDGEEIVEGDEDDEDADGFGAVAVIVMVAAVVWVIGQVNDSSSGRPPGV